MTDETLVDQEQEQAETASVEEQPKKKRDTNWSVRFNNADALDEFLAIFEAREKELGGDPKKGDVIESFLPAMREALSGAVAPQFGTFRSAYDSLSRKASQQVYNMLTAADAALKDNDEAWLKKVDEKQEIINKRDETIKVLQDDLKAAKDEAEQLAELPKQIEAKDEAITALKGQLADQAAAKDAQISALQAVIDGHENVEAQLAETVKLNAELQARASGLSAELAAAQQQIAVCGVRLDAANEAIAGLKESVSAADARAEKAAVEASARVAKADADARERLEAAEQRERAAREDADRREQAAKAEAEKRVSEAKQEAAQHAERMAASVAEAHSFEIERLKAEQAAALQEAEAKLNEARSAVAELTVQLEAVKKAKNGASK